MKSSSNTSPRAADSLSDAWAELFDAHAADVWRYVASLIGSDSHAVADTVQETFLAAARGFAQYDAARGTFRAWVMGIAHRQVALYWRRLDRDRIRPTALVEQTLADSSDGDGVGRLLRMETIDLVRRVLAELPPESAALLQGKYGDGLSVSELVLRFGGTTEAVRSRLARARRDFRKRYEHAMVEHSRERGLGSRPGR